MESTDPRAAAGELAHTQSSSVRDRAAHAGRALSRTDAVGRYIVLDSLGAGAMAAVYRAYDAELDRRVALKVLHPHAITVAREERLLHEARVLARLAHPNIVTVFDAGSVDGRSFVAIELVEGGTMRAWLTEKKRTWLEVVAAFAKAGSGLAAAHDAGLVHQDFKPDNVLMGRDDRVLVADFGLAREDAPEELPSPSASPAGTPAYMAPELFDGAPADARSDQYAFCVSLYEALYGARPFQASSIPALVELARRGIAERALRSDVPSWLHAIVRRGLSPEPSLRFDSMRSLLDALPSDPEADVRHSNAGRAALIATVLSLQFTVGLWLDRPGSRAVRAAPSGAQVLLWVLATALVAAAIIARFRQQLLANRGSRQVLAGLAALYYTSVVVEYASQRFAAPEAFTAASTFAWAGACMFCLALSVHRLFFATAAVSWCASLTALAWPEAAPWLSRLTPFAMALLLIARWGSAGQRSRASPNASTQR